MNTICKISVSKEHLCTPFIHQIANDHRYSLSLTTREKVFAIALAVLTAPLAFISFYMITAYFKYRHIKQMSSTDGLSLQVKCPVTQKDILILHKGFDTFRINEEVFPICQCCHQITRISSMIFKHCKYSYAGNLSEDEKIIEVKDKIVQKEIKYPIKPGDFLPAQFSPFDKKDWKFFLLKVHPLNAK